MDRTQFCARVAQRYWAFQRERDRDRDRDLEDVVKVHANPSNSFSLTFVCEECAVAIADTRK